MFNGDFCVGGLKEEEGNKNQEDEDEGEENKKQKRTKGVGAISIYEIERDDEEKEFKFNLIQEFEPKHREGVTSIIQLNKFYLASSSNDSTIIIWSKNVQQNNAYLACQVLLNHKSYVINLVNLSRLVLNVTSSTKKIMPKDDEMSFASCSDDNTIIVWSSMNYFQRNYKEIFLSKQVLNLHANSVICMLVMNELSELITGDSNGTLIIWSYSHLRKEFNQQRPKQALNTNVWVTCLCLCNNKTNNTDNNDNKVKVFASGHSNGAIRIWSKPNGEHLYSLHFSIENCHSNYIDSIIYLSKVNHLITTCYEEYKINIFNLNLNFKEEEEGEEKKVEKYKLKQFLQHERVYTLIGMSNDVLMSGGGDENLKIWQAI